MSPFTAELPVLEFYTEPGSGARLELHPWFYFGDRQYLGFTRVLPPHTGRDRVLSVGEELVIPAGRPRVDPFNATDQPITVRSVFSPGPVSLLAFGRTLGQAIRDGKTNAQQELPLPHLLLMLAQPDSVILAARLPAGPLRRLLRLAAPVLRRRGYRPAPGLRDRAAHRRR